METLARAITEGLVASCHDCSEGGIAVAAAEMAFAGGFGANVDLGGVPVDFDPERVETILFSESNTRFVCEIAPKNAPAFEAALGSVPHSQVGRVVATDRLVMTHPRQGPVIDENIWDLKEAWQAPLRW
jgi:phosphoribosylformylglycinamidine synthase